MADEVSGSSNSFAVFRSSTLCCNRDLRLRERSDSLERLLQRPHLYQLDRDEHRSRRVPSVQWSTIRDHGVQCRDHLGVRISEVWANDTRPASYHSSVDWGLFLPLHIEPKVNQFAHLLE